MEISDKLQFWFLYRKLTCGSFQKRESTKLAKFIISQDRKTKIYIHHTESREKRKSFMTFEL